MIKNIKRIFSSSDEIVGIVKEIKAQEARKVIMSDIALEKRLYHEIKGDNREPVYDLELLYATAKEFDLSEGQVDNYLRNEYLDRAPSVEEQKKDIKECGAKLDDGLILENRLNDMREIIQKYEQTFALCLNKKQNRLWFLKTWDIPKDRHSIKKWKNSSIRLGIRKFPYIGNSLLVNVSIHYQYEGPFFPLINFCHPSLLSRSKSVFHEVGKEFNIKPEITIYGNPSKFYLLKY